MMYIHQLSEHTDLRTSAFRASARACQVQHRDSEASRPNKDGHRNLHRTKDGPRVVYRVRTYMVPLQILSKILISCVNQKYGQ